LGTDQNSGTKPYVRPRNTEYSDRNICWPRRVLPLVSHVKYASQERKVSKKTRQTDGQTPDRYITLTATGGQRNNGVLS